MKVLIGRAEEVGCKTVIMTSDQEPAVLQLTVVVKRETKVAVVSEESPVGESNSLGCINLQLQIMQGQARTWRGAVEARYRQRLEGAAQWCLGCFSTLLAY